MASSRKEGRKVDYCVPDSGMVNTMNENDISLWIDKLIGTSGNCITADSKRKLLQKYLQKQEAGASLVELPLSSRVDQMSHEEVSELLLSQIGSFAECKTDESQRNLLKTYLLNKELKNNVKLRDIKKPLSSLGFGNAICETAMEGRGKLMNYIYRRSKDPVDYEAEHGSDNLDEPSKTIPDVATMKIAEVIELMKYANITITESGSQNRELLREYLYTKDWKGSHGDKMQETVNKAMKKYITGKENLQKIYIEIENIARTDPFKEKVSQYMKQFQDTMAQFGTHDIEICIFGWTCSGKSTFFNILLGEDIMQTYCLPDTRCLVRLHNSQTRKIEFVAKDNSLKTVPLSADPEDAKRELKSILDQFSGSDTSLGDVKLYWPVPRLHKNVVFVDVPGIGDTNVITQQVMEHVSKASGHICIINSADGGGILEGGIVQLFRMIKAIASREGQTKENLGNVLCVCNKWDFVKIHDREIVLEHIRKRLEDNLGILNNWQIIPFSALVELQHLQLRARPTNEFVKILEGLERLVSGTTEKRLSDLFGCINDLQQRSFDIIKEECLAQTEKVDKLTDETMKKEKELKEAKEKMDNGAKAIERLIDSKKADLIKELQDYLNSSKMNEVYNWKKDTPTVENCEAKGLVLVRDRIIELITKWAENEDGLLKKAIADTKKECLQQSAEIAAYFDSTKEIKIGDCPTGGVKITLKPLILSVVGLSVIDSVLGMVRTLGIGFAFSAGFGIVLVPVVIGLNYGIYRHRVRSKIVSKMTRLTQKAMTEVSSDERTETLISTIFECPSKKWIEEFRDMMKKKIECIQEDLDKQKGHVQSERNILSTWESLRDTLMTYSTSLRNIGQEYINDDLMQ